MEFWHICDQEGVQWGGGREGRYTAFEGQPDPLLPPPPLYFPLFFYSTFLFFCALIVFHQRGVREVCVLRIEE